jgi:GH24 family phage-related lysozyme (muramidase)
VNISDRGLAFIAGWEGFRPYLYNDPANATVAIGILVHLGAYHPARGVCGLCDAWPRPWEPEKWLTEEQGRALLLDKANARREFAGGQNYVGEVRHHFPDVNQNQFDAMVSFAYNLGTGHLATVAAVYYTGGDVCAELRKYIMPAWASEGLLRRRKAECALFKAPEEDEMWVRFNGVAKFFTDRFLSGGPEGIMRIDIDFPELPAAVKAVDLDVYLAPDSAGSVIFSDGNGAHAGKVTPRAPHQVIRVVPNEQHQVRFLVEGVAARTELVGIVGYLA